MKEKIATPTDEQEFHINYSPFEDREYCEVYTTIPWCMKYLEKMINNYPEQCRLIKDDQYSFTVRIPFKLVKPRNPRTVSEERKEALINSLAIARANK